MTGPALLLAAHGSRDPRHAATVHALAGLVRAARPGLEVAAGFLDHCAPRVPQTAGRLAAEGADAIVAVPLLLTRAHHARTDLPAVLREAAGRHGPAIRQAAVLGPSPLLVAALEQRLAEAGSAAADRASTGVVLASAGTSDPRALAALAGLARRWQRTGWAAVVPAFASAAPPDTAQAVHELRRRPGVDRVAVAPYLLAPGRLPDRIADAAAAAGADLVAAVLGPAPQVAALVLRRYDGALAEAAGARRSA